ncbi:MAG: tetratricopeptide repeat protein [Cyclobacteriaceae bacterium]|nr:tetratricopeptide repeat protein [Cyclobacteriaceae bacterium]
MGCLFLWLSTALQAQKNSWLSDEPYSSAYQLCLKLMLDESREQIQLSEQPKAIYISAMADMLELLITEDASLFPAAEKRYEKRVEILKQISPVTDESLFVLAELRLQWAFIYLKFGHDFSSAWNIRQAHLVAQECLRKYPNFIPINKTSGILEIMIGSVPEKYQWILNLLGMKGSVETGFVQLAIVQDKEESLRFEADLLYHLIEGFVLQQTDSALTALENMHRLNPDNKLILFLGASLAIKNSFSEMAMILLEKLKTHKDGLAIYYADYLLGEVYLHQGNYSKSIQAYKSFIKYYKGSNYIKDAYYKTGLAYWLNIMPDQAQVHFELAEKNGKEVTEADKYASRSLAERDFTNIKLTKVRYSIDGGYYDEAVRILKTLKKEELVSRRELTEYNYRFARLYHKTTHLSDAKKFYSSTIELNGTESWYFAPNACLQLGYIFRDEGNIEEAKIYFTKALSYKKHAYKNSIDSKAKSALAQLKKYK